jgi:uncharacterized membrane protein YdbT with pleckstrin-like domain
MTHETRDTVLFWCQVGMAIAVMVLLLGLLVLAWYFITAQVRTMEEDRAKDRVMLQQHLNLLADHDRAREESHAAFMALLARPRQ